MPQSLAFHGRIGPNEHSVQTMESKRVRTNLNSLGAHPVAVRTQWFALSGGAHHGNAWSMPFEAIFWLWGQKIVLSLSVYLVAAEFCYKCIMACNLPEKAEEWGLHRVSDSAAHPEQIT